MNEMIVTILILIDGFLQFDYDTDKLLFYNGHNPYFNRWFSAIWESLQEQKHT